MPVQTPLAVAIFFTMWWIILLTVLPLGVHSLHEEGEIPKGADPGAPIAPQLLRKAGITTVVTVVLFTSLMLAVKFWG